MRWQNERRSDNVEDRRGISAGQVAVGGGIGTILIVLVMSFLTASRPQGPDAADASRPAGRRPAETGGQEPEEERQADFVKATLALTEDVWTDLFARAGRTYEEPFLVMFSNQVNTEGCGLASTAVGPFYCPADQKVYIDLAFYDELKRRFNAPGEFAQAYVMPTRSATTFRTCSVPARRSPSAAPRQQGRGEQALRDARTPGRLLRRRLGPPCREEKAHPGIRRCRDALNAASAIGDDRLQRQSQGYVVPDSFTHGTSEQRVRWFRRGLQTGDISGGDTFNAGADL